MLLFFFYIFLFFFCSSNLHILIVPYPYYNREYAIKETKYITVNQLSFFLENDYKGQEKVWEFVFNGIVFQRTAARAYDLLGNNRYLAAAFHGAAEFDLSDLSPHSRIVYIRNNTDQYKNTLKDNEYIKYEGIVAPQYQLEENGIMLAADLVRKISDYTTFLFQFRLPIINKTVYHNRGWRDINYNYENNIINDDRLYLESLNKYFKVRFDYLSERNMLPDVRSFDDFKKVNGVAFLDYKCEDYFLEKPSNIDILNKYEEKYDQLEKEDDKIRSKRINEEEWYAMTEFNEMSLPTQNAIEFYQLLQNGIIPVSREFMDSVTKGNFFSKQYNWNTYKTNYIAPLDMQFNITKIFPSENIIFQGLFAFVIPIDNRSNNKNSNNYIAKSFFKDQYAFRIGSQITCDFNQYYKILFYGSWQYYFPTDQTIPAIFDGVNAYGLAPLYLKGKISWYEWYLSSHLVMKYNENIGLDLGYQYIYKSGDKIIPECESFYLINGDQQKLNYTKWTEFSSSIANLLSVYLYYYIGYWQLDIGIRGLVGGKNIIKLQEYSLRVGLDF
jgi:hypothetical protein